MFDLKRLRYANHVKISGPTSGYVKDKLKLNERGKNYILVTSFYILLKSQCTNHQPISVADTG